MLKAFMIWMLILLPAFTLMAGSGIGESGSVFMTSLPPNAPELSAPTNGLASVPDSVLLTWRSLIHTSGFNVQVSTEDDFNTLLLDETGVADTLYLMKNLDFSTLHYWRVNAVNAAGTSPYSTVWSFSTLQPLSGPQLMRPEDGAFVDNEGLVLEWNPIDGAIEYHLQVSDSPDFSNLIIEVSDIQETNYALNLETGNVWYWRVSAINEAGEGDFSGIWSFSNLATDIDKESIPKNFDLLPAYPNPFNPTTFITYHLPKTADVSLVIYNSMGQVIRNLERGQRQAGRYSIQWDTRDNHGMPVTSGMYLCRFESDGHVFIRKMMLLR